MSTQLEGGSGKANNVEGEKDDQAGIGTHNFGTGENTAVAQRQMEINRQMRERDQGVDARYLIAAEPDRPLPAGRSPEPNYPSGDSQITK